MRTLLGKFVPISGKVQLFITHKACLKKAIFENFKPDQNC